jgi:ABC-type transporter Mla subunit MlaD
MFSERHIPMPTQEERLITLEQATAASQKFQQQAAAHIRETEENTTILLSVIRSQGQDIRHMVERLDTIDTRLDRVETRLDRVETLLAQILARLPEKP